MPRGVFVAIKAAPNVGTRCIVSSPALLLAPSAYSQDVMGVPSATPDSFSINSLGWTTLVPVYDPRTPQPRRKS